MRPTKPAPIQLPHRRALAIARYRLDRTFLDPADVLDLDEELTDTIIEVEALSRRDPRGPNLN